MELINKAIEGRKKAYAPYSNFLVGAAVLLKDGTIITGCNVENASYGLSMCAERNTLFKMISMGYHKEDIVAMAVVGNDVIKLAATQAHLNMDDFAFVPMPSDGINKRYSLYGGTPYVFAKNASDEQVEGVLKFFDYIGRSPNITEISKEAMRYGFEVAKRKNQPIMPEISPWINEEYVNYKDELLNEFINVNMGYYNEFFANIDENKHPEVEYLPQEMYEILDNAISQVFENPSTCNTQTILTTCNAKYQAKLDEEYNK